MKVLYVGVRETMSPDRDRCLRALRMAGIEPQAVSDSSALEGLLASDEYGGWLHIVSAKGESAGAVAELAARHPERLTIVAGFGGGVARDFASSPPASEAELLVVLEEFVDVGSEIRCAVPRWLTRRWVNTVLRPELEARLVHLSPEERALVERLLYDSPLVWGAADRQALSARDTMRLNALLAREGLREVPEIHNGMRVLQYHIGMACVALTPEQSARVCGLSNTGALEAAFAAVLGAGDLYRIHEQGTERLASVVLGYICGLRSGEIIPSQVPSVPPALLVWVERGGVAGAVAPTPVRGVADVSAELNAFVRELQRVFGKYVTRLIRARLRDDDSVSDARQDVWFAVYKKLAAKGIAALPLSVAEIATHTEEWKRELAAACQNVASNALRTEQRQKQLQRKLASGIAEVGLWHSVQPSPEALVLTAELRARLRAAVASLEEKERAVVELRYGERKTFKEVALDLGVTERTARRWHVAALTHLRVALGVVKEDVPGE